MTAILRNWSVCASFDLYTPPELQAPRLQGEVYGHPKYLDGSIIVASKVLGYDEKTKEVICFSRRYKLGRINPKYAKLFPNARRRVMASLRKLQKRVKHENV